MKCTSLDENKGVARIQFMHKEIHGIQADILKRLLLTETARFSGLKPQTVSSDLFTFHLKQLIEGKVIEKMENGSYRLTPQGKDYANRFDTDSGPVKTEKQAKLTVLVIASRKKGKVREYAMQQRLKHPFF